MMHVGHKIAEFQGLSLFAELSSNVPWTAIDNVWFLLSLLHNGINPALVDGMAHIEAMPARIHYVVTAPLPGGAA